jgi:hypothetical protein
MPQVCGHGAPALDFPCILEEQLEENVLRIVLITYLPRLFYLFLFFPSVSSTLSAS